MVSDPTPPPPYRGCNGIQPGLCLVKQGGSGGVKVASLGFGVWMDFGLKKSFLIQKLFHWKRLVLDSNKPFNWKRVGFDWTFFLIGKVF